MIMSDNNDDGDDGNESTVMLGIGHDGQDQCNLM